MPKEYQQHAVGIHVHVCAHCTLQKTFQGGAKSGTIQFKEGGKDLSPQGLLLLFEGGGHLSRRNPDQYTTRACVSSTSS